MARMVCVTLAHSAPPLTENEISRGGGQAGEDGSEEAEREGGREGGSYFCERHRALARSGGPPSVAAVHHTTVTE